MGYTITANENTNVVKLDGKLVNPPDDISKIGFYDMELIVEEDESCTAEWTFNQKKYDSYLTSLEKIEIENIKLERIVESKEKLEEYISNHPIKSDCHGGVTKTYSITTDKQSYIQNMISMTQVANASGIDFQPSWNATGEECTYDWTLEELQTLAFQMAMTVRPLVSQQQKYEVDIKACNTIEELNAINIVYEQES